MLITISSYYSSKAVNGQTVGIVKENEIAKI